MCYIITIIDEDDDDGDAVIYCMYNYYAINT